MIEYLRFAVGFCFWLLLFLLLGSLCALGIWSLVIVMREMRRRK